MMRIYLRFAILLVCGSILPAPAATYYVSTAGNDSGDGSASAPWHTIQHAADALKPGDTAIIRGGAYRETITLRTSGTPQSR